MDTLSAQGDLARRTATAYERLGRKRDFWRVSDPRDFFDRLNREIGRDRIMVRSAFYDFAKRLGGDGMGYAPIDKRSVLLDEEQDMCVALFDPSVLTTDERALLLALEHRGFIEVGETTDGRVAVSPSESLKSDADQG